MHLYILYPLLQGFYQIILRHVSIQELSALLFMLL